MNNYVTKFFLSENIPTPLVKCKNYFDRVLFSKFPQDCDFWLAGGALRSYFCKEEIVDLDIYFPSNDEQIKFEKHLNSMSGITTNYSSSYRSYSKQSISSYYESDNSKKVVSDKFIVPLDIIKLYHKSPLECLKTFDFTICCAAITRTYIIYHENYFIDILGKTLTFNSDPLSLKILTRMQKYNQRGYYMDRKEVVKLANIIQKLDLNNEIDNPLGYKVDGSLFATK